MFIINKPFIVITATYILYASQIHNSYAKYPGTGKEYFFLLNKGHTICNST